MASIYPAGLTDAARSLEVQAIQRLIGNAYEAIQALNWHYGKGEIASVTFDNETERGVATLYVLHGTETAVFRIVEGIVHYKGHHRKIAR